MGSRGLHNSIIDFHLGKPASEQLLAQGTASAQNCSNASEKNIASLQVLQ